MTDLLKKLKITWKKPLHVNDTLSLVIYRYKHDIEEPTCENMTTIGELVYETKEIDAGFFDDEVGKGKWHYAIYSKNKAGLSPCAIDTYEVTFDSDGDGVTDSLDVFPYDPNRASGNDSDGDGIDDEFDLLNAGISITSLETSELDVTFSIVAVGSDIHSWRYSIDDGETNPGSSGSVTLRLLNDGAHILKVEALNVEGEPIMQDQRSFNLSQTASINIDRLEANIESNVEIDVTVVGTDARYWGYRIRNSSGQVVSYTAPQIDLNIDSTRSIVTTNLTPGQSYEYEVFVLDEDENIIADQYQSVNLPNEGADKLWGTDTGAGEIGIPEPDINNETSGQGSFRVLSWPNLASLSITTESESVVQGGFLFAQTYTRTPNVKSHILSSSVFNQMIPEKWYFMTLASIDNSDGNRCLRLYVNGVLCSQVVVNSAQETTDHDLIIGAVRASSWQLDYAFNGKIDQPTFWNEGLTPGLIADIYNGGAGLSYNNMPSGLKSKITACYEFDSAAVVSSNTHTSTSANSMPNAFGYNVEKVNNQDAPILKVGAEFVNHPITRPGGKVSAHAFTPCYLPGMRTGINPITGFEYTSQELSNFYSQSSRKVAVLDPNLNIDKNLSNFSVSCWLRREGRAVGYTSSPNVIKGSGTGFIISEYNGWSSTKNSKLSMYSLGPSYESDSSTYWMYGK